MKVKVRRHGTYAAINRLIAMQSVRAACEDTHKEITTQRDRLGRLIKRLEELEPRAEGFVKRITTLQDKRTKWRKMGAKKRGVKLKLPYTKGDREMDRKEAEEAQAILKKTQDLLTQLREPYLKLLSQAELYDQLLTHTENWQYKEMSSVIH